MRIKFTVFSLIAIFGQTFGGTVEKTAITRKPLVLKDEPKMDQILLKNLFDTKPKGLIADNSDLFFDIENSHKKMEKAMDDHKKVMDKAMDEAFEETNKRMGDFDKYWELFDKDMTNLFDKQFGESDQNQRTILQKQTTKNVKPVVQEQKKEPQNITETDLPLFKPNNEQQNKEQQNKVHNLKDNLHTKTDPSTADINKKFNFTIIYKTPNWELTDENSTKSNSSDMEIIGDLFDTVFNTFSKLGTFIVGDKNVTIEDNSDTLEESELESLKKMNELEPEKFPEHSLPFMMVFELPRKLKYAYDIHALENVLMSMATQMEFPDYTLDLQNLKRDGFTQEIIKASFSRIFNLIEVYGKHMPVGKSWEKSLVEVSDIKQDWLSNYRIIQLAESRVVDRILSMNLMEEPQNSETEKPKLSFEEQVRREFSFATQTDSGYEWFDYLLVGLLAITSAVLLVVTLLICFQRNRRTKNVNLIKRNGSVGQTSLENENLDNKYKEKIQTIFVSMNNK